MTKLYELWQFVERTRPEREAREREAREAAFYRRMQARLLYMPTKR